MDLYTEHTKFWLDDRFSNSDENEIYFAHQPIYGFLKGHCDPGLLERYIPTFQMMNALSYFDFDSFLDIGGAEGYKAYTVRNIFHAKVMSSDLSEEACRRAKEIFDVDSMPADIHALPFRDGEFDIVGCSETLEHVKDIKNAIGELLRVAKKGIIITVPHETPETVQKNIADGITHAHIHSFATDSLDFLTSKGYRVISEKMISSLILDMTAKIEHTPPKYAQDAKVNGMLKKIVSIFIQMDGNVCKVSSSYTGLLFVVVKDPTSYRQNAIIEISPEMILNVSVPYYHMMPVERPPFLAGLLRNISFFVDRLDQTKRSIEVDGWACIKREDSRDSEIRIILYASDKQYFMFETEACKRPDVTAFFGGIDRDDSGFSAVIPLDAVPAGKYHIGFYIKKQHIEGYGLTHQTVIIRQ